MPADRSDARGPDTPPVVFLMGPTASGKTGLAVDLAARWPLDIVSVDSAMVYRGMDIGTAKPDAAVQAVAPHRLIDIRDPARAYSAAEFANDARNEIEAIHVRGRIPLLVGGTMLYFRALERGLSPLPPADTAVRERLSARAQQSGWPALHAELAAADPVTGERLHPNDGQRIQRALEILTLTGEPPSRLLAESGDATMSWPAIKLAVAPAERHTLHTRIDSRFRTMMDAGFLGEVEKLRMRPDLHADMPAMRAVGYRQLWHCLDGHHDLETAVGRGVVATRQLAKRQLTWLRREQDLAWLNADDPRLSEQAHEALACRLKLA